MTTNIYRIKTTILSLLLAFSASIAQDDMEPTHERMQELKAQKVAFLTQRMELTPEQAQHFWPVYNQFDAEMEAQRSTHRTFRRETRKNGAILTDEKAQMVIEEEMNLRQRELDLRKRYNTQFIKVVGASKTARLYEAEHAFNRELLHRFKEKRSEREGPGERR